MHTGPALQLLCTQPKSCEMHYSNEVISPEQLCASDSNAFSVLPFTSSFNSPEHAEADTFFCFTNLMAEIRDNFIKSLDDSQCGITYKMEKVYSTLKEKDVELYLKLVRSWVFLLVVVGMWGREHSNVSQLCSAVPELE